MENLRIEDLSVGDWVKYETMPTKVMYINGFDSVIRGKASNGNIVIAHIDCFKPIPITAEVLEMNGWLPPRAEIYRDTWWWTNKVDKAIEASEYQGEWQLTIIEQKEIQCNYRLGLGLKYVHHLQHALRLAGAGKEIVV